MTVAEAAGFLSLAGPFPADDAGMRTAKLPSREAPHSVPIIIDAGKN